MTISHRSADAGTAASKYIQALKKLNKVIQTHDCTEVLMKALNIFTDFVVEKRVLEAPF